MDYQYLLSSTRTHQPGAAAGTGNQTLKTEYWNDHTGRKTGLLLQAGGLANTHLAEYNYDFRERLIERNLHAGLYGSTWGWLQSVDYAYNDQDWLTAINTKNATGSSLALSATCSPSMPNPGSTLLVKHPEDNDLFYLELRYDQLFTTSSPTGGTISGLSGTLQKGGNIAQMAWRVRGRERQAYAFTYDTLSRLKTASYFDVNTSGTATASNRFNEALIYDLRGNIGTLQRQGFIQSTCNFGQIDNLAYTYAAGTNRLTSVADASGKSEGFKPGSGAGYTYDGNGNLKSDSYKGISTITYNHLNLPKLITFSSGNTIEIVYDASGNKLRKIVKQGATVQYEQDYSGGIEYRKTPAAGTFRIEAIYHEEGRYFNLNVDASNTPSWRKEYALRDHLGSTRLLFADKDGDGMVEVTSNAATNEVLQENHYYPFGLSYGGSHWMNDAARDNGYKYNGKELNEDWGLGWYDYGARCYMPDLGKFSSIDRFAEKFGYQSPFAYAGDSPINFIDVNGDSIGVNLLNGTSKKAFNAFFATNEGKAFIGQFAAKGQIINGYTFTADGQYHRKGIDLTYSDRNFGKGKEHNGAKTTGGNKGGTIVDGRLKLGVSINTTAEESSFIGKVTAITHESFLHVQEYSFDYSDNKKFDFSHDPFYMKTKDNSPDSRHHLMFHHKANASTTHPWR